MNKNLAQVNDFVRNEFKIKDEVISIAFDSNGVVAGVIFKDNSVEPFFGKDLEKFNKFLKEE